MTKADERLKSVATFGEYDRSLSELDIETAAQMFSGGVEGILLAHMDRFSVDASTGKRLSLVHGRIMDTKEAPEGQDGVRYDSHLEISVSMTGEDGIEKPKIQLCNEDKRGRHLKYTYTLGLDGVVCRADDDLERDGRSIPGGSTSSTKTGQGRPGDIEVVL